MSALVTIAGLLFVVSVSGVVYVWKYSVGRDAGPPDSMLLIAGVLGTIISLILFGVAFGSMLGSVTS